MALAIRLRQQGRKNHIHYRVVVTDSRSPRSGAYIEKVGTYAPLDPNEDCIVSLEADRIEHWLSVGAQMTESVTALVRRHAPSIIRTQMERIAALKMKRREKRKARKTQAA